MHKDFWSLPGTAPVFCNHGLFRKAGQINQITWARYGNNRATYCEVLL